MGLKLNRIRTGRGDCVDERMCHSKAAVVRLSHFRDNHARHDLLLATTAKRTRSSGSPIRLQLEDGKLAMRDRIMSFQVFF
jgi:hypothetical protein